MKPLKNNTNLILFIIILVFILFCLYAYYTAKEKRKPTNNCPQYIDCMPGPGRSVDCKIPAGCEGYTEIAY